MSSHDSDLINDYFVANARDLTPASVRHVARLLYLPVSTDQEMTKYCVSILSATELERANRFALQGDRVLFKQRRAFRRFCGALALGSPGRLSRINFDQTEAGRPYLSELPDFYFSFASCQLGYLGAWSATQGIGVDLENHSRTLEAANLAQRFFSAAEARAVEGQGGPERLQTFFRLWSLKEAALKSIGEGLPFGLNSFEFELEPALRIVHAPDDFGGPAQFDPHLIELADSCIALVIRRPC